MLPSECLCIHRTPEENRESHDNSEGAKCSLLNSLFNFMPIYILVATAFQGFKHARTLKFALLTAVEHCVCDYFQTFDSWGPPPFTLSAICHLYLCAQLRRLTYHSKGVSATFKSKHFRSQLKLQTRVCQMFWILIRFKDCLWGAGCHGCADCSEAGHEGPRLMLQIARPPQPPSI